MNVDKIIDALRRMKVETGSLMCMGCGYEHNCGIHGCAIMSMAADRLANDQAHILALQKAIENLRSGRRWIPVTERLPENNERVLAYCKDRMIREMKWSWVKNAWLNRDVGDGYVERFVTNWMPLPEAPEVE